MKSHPVSFAVILVSTAVALSGCGPSDPGAADPMSLNNSLQSFQGLDAGPGAIVAPYDQWTWVDFPDSRCASGTPTGVAINPHAGSREVMFYFEGGGGCYDGPSCWGPVPLASHLTGYDSTTFAAAGQKNMPTLTRGDGGNPFATMNMVYVPYCTGDLHSGAALAELAIGDGGVVPTYFYGGKDMDLFLQRLVPTFPHPHRVWAMGTSAGGFATYLNFDRLHRAFGAPVEMLDDSGPAIERDAGMSNDARWAIWGYVPPAQCSSCAVPSDVLNYDLRVQSHWSPQGKFGFMTFAEDTVISARFGYPLAQYPAAMAAFVATLPASPRAAAFIVTNAQEHVVQSDPVLAPAYLPWITQMVNGDPTWGDVTYAHP